MKIAYRIMAVRERKDYVYEIVKKLDGTDVKVFWDDRPAEEKKGTYYTQLKCINDVLAGDYTHIVLLQDDILLVNDFDECVKKLIQFKPNDLWTLFCPRLKKEQLDFQNPYCFIFPANTWGPANIIPVGMLKMIMEFREEKLPNYIYDDGLYLMYLIENGLPCYTTNVALLQHLCPVNSMLGYNDKRRVSKVWAGEDVYGAINWNSKTLKRYNFPTSCDIEKEYAKYGKR